MTLTTKPSAQNCRGLGKVGYVANSTHTVLGDCYSAGRIYDKIGARAAVVCRKTAIGYGVEVCAWAKRRREVMTSVFHSRMSGGYGFLEKLARNRAGKWQIGKDPAIGSANREAENSHCVQDAKYPNIL